MRAVSFTLLYAIFCLSNGSASRNDVEHQSLPTASEIRQRTNSLIREEINTPHVKSQSSKLRSLPDSLDVRSSEPSHLNESNKMKHRDKREAISSSDNPRLPEVDSQDTRERRSSFLQQDSLNDGAPGNPVLFTRWPSSGRKVNIVELRRRLWKKMEDARKRGPSDNFYGMRGKREPKRPNGFLGMRGKKDFQSGNCLPSQEQTDNDALNTSELEELMKRGVVDGFVGMRGKKGSADEDSLAEDDWGWNVDKRVQIDRFLGMRGKKDDESEEWISNGLSKRRGPKDGFVGMRGKKSGARNAESNRNKPEAENEKRKGFVAMRGKKDVIPSEATETDSDSDTRTLLY